MTTSAFPSNQSRNAHNSHGASQRKQASWEMPYPWLAGLRAWSPAVVPPLLGLLLIFLTTLPASSSSSARAGANPLPALFLLYFVCGALYGLALYFAPSLNSWAKIALGGGVLYSLVALWLLGGALLLVLGSVAWSAPILYYLHASRHTIPADTLHVTTLAGRYWRTLGPRRALLLPGERVRAEVDNQPDHYAVALQRVQLRDAAGERFIAQASAIVSYHQAPTDALRKPLTPDSWQSDFHKAIKELLRDTLAIQGHAALLAAQSNRRGRAGGPAYIDGWELARVLLAQLRRTAHGQGLAVNCVRVRDLALLRDSRFAGQGRAVQAAQVSPALLPPLGLSNWDEPPTDREEPDRKDAQDALGTALPIDMLLDLYNAVRAQQINEPATVRAIAQAFLAVARDPERSAACPYDAERMARLLLTHAAALDRRKTL